MARIRTLKPEIWSDEKFGHLNRVSQLVYIGLITQADDAGRLLDSVRLIEGLLFPFDEGSTSVRRSLDELSSTGLIERGFTRSGQPVIQICGWANHQRIDRPNLEAALPEIHKARKDLEDFDESSTKDRRSLDEDSSTGSTTNDQRSTTYDQERESRAREGSHPVFGAWNGNTVLALKGLYGWPPDDIEGTDERVWPNGLEEWAKRRQCLTIACQRLQGEDRAYHGKQFRRTLIEVIGEQTDEASDMDDYLADVEAV